MINKKAELTTQQIVMIIILITSFAIILFLLFRLNLGEETNAELCRNSVVMGGKSLLPEATPLNCKTEYICITKDGSCEDMTKPRIEKVKTKEDVYKILADEMAECWWMFGEGKVNYVGKDFRENLYCSICDQIAFDDSLLKIEGIDSGELDKKNFYIYLTKEPMSQEGPTYSEYLFKTKELSKIHSGKFGEIDLERQHYIMMGITSEINKIGWVAAGVTTGAVVVGGTIAVLFTGGTIFVAPVIVGAIVGGVTGGMGANEILEADLVGILVKGDSGNEYLSPSIVEINSQTFKDLKCESITTLS